MWCSYVVLDIFRCYYILTSEKSSGLFRTINLKPHYNVELLRNLSDKGRCLPGLHDRRS